MSKVQGHVYLADCNLTFRVARLALKDMGLTERNPTSPCVHNMISVFIDHTDSPSFGNVGEGSVIHKSTSLTSPDYPLHSELSYFLKHVDVWNREKSCVKIKLNDLYEATVVHDGKERVAKVRCQTFKFDAIKALYEAMQK